MLPIKLPKVERRKTRTKAKLRDGSRQQLLEIILLVTVFHFLFHQPVHKWNVREKVSFSFYRHQTKFGSWRICFWNFERFDLGGMFQRVFEKVPVSFVQFQRGQQDRKLRTERCQHKTGARRTESKARSQILRASEELQWQKGIILIYCFIICILLMLYSGKFIKTKSFIFSSTLFKNSSFEGSTWHRYFWNCFLFITYI